jgi:F420-non-reducing hydrogenase small subunit
MTKPKVGVYWGASCGGCDIAVLEIHERVIELLEVAEIVFWPCVMDFKYDDVRAMPDGGIDVCLFNGGIRSEENEEIARLLRAKSKALVAYGACAASGGIPGLANLYDREEIFERIYDSTESTENPEHRRPEVEHDLGGGRSIHLPEIAPALRTLSQVVEVDYFMPGCPPTEEQTWSVLLAAASGELPEPGSVVGAGEDRALCDECPLERRDVKVERFHRPHEIVPDGTSCLLEQGIVCVGPATRSGCAARCPSVQMPCRGCYGPAAGVEDQGAKMIGAIGSVLATEDPAAIERCIRGIADPAGTFYRFTLPSAALGSGRTWRRGER